jgi:hypothetical protein
MEERTYQGQVYRRAGPNEDWQLVPSQGGGNPVVGVVPSNPALVAKQQEEAGRRARAEARAIAAAERSADASVRAADRTPIGYRPAPGGGLEPIPGGPADPTAKPNARLGRAMRVGDADKLEAKIGSYSALKDAALGFQDDFAGNALTGEVENWGQGLFGTGTPGQRDWWSNFRSADNLIRNQLFGASLTEGEKRAFEQTTISPSMKPEIVRQNLERRVEIARKALERNTDRLRAAGYNEDEIAAAIGEFAPDFGADRPFKETAPKFQLPKAAGVGEAAGSDVDGATGRGGSQPIPELAGYENQIIDMIGKGATSGEVVSYMNERLKPFNAQVGVPLHSWIDGIVKKHKANPSQPVRSLGQGWEMLYHRDVPESESTVLGRAADTGPGNALMNGINSLFAGAPAWAAGKQDVLSAANEERPGWAIGGKIAGSVGAMSGINAAAKTLGGAGSLLTRGGGVGGDMLYGGVQGGLEGGPGGAFAGALSAGVGNKVGSAAVSGTGRAIRGVSDPVVKRLSAQNIPLTSGMIMGRNNSLGRFMNGLESMPVINGMMARRYEDAREGVNRAAFGEALDGIEGKATEIGAEGLAQAYDATDNAYRGALGGRAFDANEPQFIDEMGAAISRGEQVPKLGEDFSHIVRKDVAPMFDANGVLTGERLQAALQSLRERRSSFAGQPLGSDIGDALTDVEGAMSNMVSRQAPEVMPKLDAANAAYRKINILGDAYKSGVNEGGAFTPAQLNRAALNNTQKYMGKRAAVTGDRPFQQLADDAQKIIPSKIPDSGTGTRLAAMAVPAVLAGGAGGADYAGAGPAVTVPLAVLAALTSKSGARIAQKALTGDRPASVAKIGNSLIKNKRKAGLFGASVAPLLSQ